VRAALQVWSDHVYSIADQSDAGSKIVQIKERVTAWEPPATPCSNRSAMPTPTRGARSRPSIPRYQRCSIFLYRCERALIHIFFDGRTDAMNEASRRGQENQHTAT
jgi:hypothetical protein